MAIQIGILGSHPTAARRASKRLCTRTVLRSVTWHENMSDFQCRCVQTSLESKRRKVLCLVACWDPVLELCPLQLGKNSPCTCASAAVRSGWNQSVAPPLLAVIRLIGKHCCPLLARLEEAGGSYGCLLEPQTEYEVDGWSEQLVLVSLASAQSFAQGQKRRGRSPRLLPALPESRGMQSLALRLCRKTLWCLGCGRSGQIRPRTLLASLREAL